MSNGGFESNTTNWTTAQNTGSAKFTVVTSPVHSGTKALRITVTAAGKSFPSLTHAAFTASTGSTYLLSFWARGGTNRAVMRAHITSAAGSAYTADFEPSNVGWDEYHYAFQASGATTVSFTFEQAASFYIDDVTVYDQTDPVIDTAMTYLWQWGQSAYAQTNTSCFDGADNDISAQLPDGRAVWLFNDTWVTPFTPNTNERGTSRSLPRNFVVVQDGNTLAPLLGNIDTVFVPEDADDTGDFYEPTDALAEGNNLQVFIDEDYIDGSGTYHLIAQAIATVPLPGLTIPDPSQFVARTFGRFLLDGGDGYIYIYDVTNEIARVPEGGLADVSAWTYYDGSDWVDDSTAAVVLPNLNTLASIERLGPNNFVAISNGGPVYAQFAPSPLGPWSKQVQVGSPPAQACVSDYYFPYIHKESAQNGVYSIGYSDYNYGSESDAVTYNKCYYNPHYIKTASLLNLSLYTLNAFNDDFHHAGSLAGWQPYGGTGSINGNQYGIDATSGDDYAVAKGIVVGDLTLEADVTCTAAGNGGQAGVFFRGSHYAVGSDAYNGYNVVLKPGAGVFLSRSDGGGVSTAMASVGMTINAGTTYHLKVVAQGNLIQIYVNGAGTPLISAADATYTVGGVGVRADVAEGAWANFVVYALSTSYRYVDWAARYFDPLELSQPAISGPSGDSTGAGISNLLKYALGIGPKLPGVPAGMPVTSLQTVGGQTYLTLTYIFAKTATSAALAVQVSGDLQTWNSGSDYTVEVSRTDNGNGTVTVVTRDTVPVSGGTGQRFIRLQVTQTAQ